MKLINFSNLKIQSKITLTSIFQFIFVITFIGFLVVFFVSRQTNEDTKDKLVSIAQSRSNHIQTYLEDHVQLLQLVTSCTALRKTLATYNETGKEADLVTITNIIKDAIIPIPQFERICILSLAGGVLASTNDKNCGNIIPNANFFINGLKSEGVYFIEEDGVYKIYISGPITLESKVIGVGMTVIGFKHLESIITNRTSLGKTGEALVAFYNEAGERKYPLKRLFEAEALPLNIQSEETAYPMKQALAGETAYFENTLDYRNEMVSAGTSYIKIANLGLVAKIDKSELSEANKQILLFIILIFIFFIFIYYLISKKVSDFISKPIIDLQHGALEVENGNLDYSFGVTSQDEVGQLSGSFNQMVKSIKEARNEIEQKVLEQTKEIKSKSRELADQKDAILNILEDVEKEKDKTERLAEDLKKFKLALENASDQVIITDVEGIVIYGNRATERITGYIPEEAIGKKAGALWRIPMPTEYYKKMWDVIKIQKKTFIGEIQNRRKNGELYTANLSISPVLNNSKEVVYFVGIEHDITHEKEVDKAKTEFVSLASHQLRTPLSSINWYTEMLLNGDAGVINEDQKKYLQEVYAGSQRMVELVNSLLNVSRLDLGTFVINPTPVNVRDMVKNLLNELKSQILEKKQIVREIYADNLPLFSADESLLRMILQNLLSNAVKYTPAGGSIAVNIRVVSGKFMIEISDTGMGIPKAQQDKVFMKLFRADNAKQSETEGTGLGLYIIKSIVDQAGGEVWFESEENKGTTFYVSFPIEGMKKKDGLKQLDM